jgi:hypothetical protein
MAYEKLSLVERFTNSSCGPCASVNQQWYTATSHNYVNSGMISHLVYNVWWPGPNDPMYLLNQADNTTRTNYYGCNAVPWIDINGAYTAVSQSSFQTAVANGNSQYAPFKIELSQDAFSESLIKIGVKIIRDPQDVTTFGNIKLRVALTEKSVSYSSPQPNGESVFYSICRKMLPNATGSSFTIPAPGDTTELSLEYVPTAAFLAAVNLDSLRIVAFIQDDGNKQIFQSTMLEVVPYYVAIIQSSSPDLVIENNEAGNFSATVQNVGFLDDSYYIDASMDAPNGWTGEYTSPNGTFQFGQQDMVTVPAGSTATVDLSVLLNAISGAAEIRVQFTSMNDPNIFTVATFRLVTTTGVPGLIIDASGEGYGDLLRNGMDQAFDYNYGVVKNDALYPSVDLTGFTLICWSTGDALPVFTSDEVNALQPFLDNGGRLFINGQNIGSDIFEASGQSQFAQDFYHNYLHANYLSNAGPTFFLRGIAGDPISNQINFGLSDVYPRSVDVFSPNDAFATKMFSFSTTSQYNSLHADDGTNRVVYLGVGLEQILDQAIKDTVVVRSINWLMNGVVLSTPNEDLIAESYKLDQNYPNPFNPATTISYSIPKESNVSLIVYDIMGKQVAELVNSKQAAGSYRVEFDATKFASGTYFYKLTTGDFISVKKMILLK